MATQSSFYVVDGSTRTFPSTKHIPTKQHCAVYLKSLSLLTWSPASVDSYSLINNSIVFDTAPSSGLYSQVEIRIADLQSELVDSPSNIAIVAGNINNVNLVGQNINDVNTIGDNINALLVIPANLTAINNISTNITELLTIDESAAIATAMANICTSTYDQFDDRYLGAKATAPLVDNDGNALVYGSLYFDTTQNFMKVWSNAGWINAGSSVNGTTERYTYSATAGQTIFAATYEAGYIDVFLNGSKLQNGVDFTAVTATNITLTNPASIGDVVDIICYAVFELSTAPTKDVVAYTVSTIADLASVPSIYTTAIVKDLDRGGTFIWSSTGTANGGTVFAGATGFWNRQYSGALNVKWFGAVGDGVTDDTIVFKNCTDNTVFTIDLNGLNVYIVDENLINNVSGHRFINGALTFGKVLGDNTNTRPVDCKTFINCFFENVTFSAPSALGFAIFSTGSSNLYFNKCSINAVKPHFLQSTGENIHFNQCKFLAIGYADGSCLQTIGNVTRGLWVNECEWNFAPNQGAGALISATNQSGLIGEYFITKNKVFTQNTAGFCIDTFVDIEPVGHLSGKVVISDNEIYNAKIWIGSSSDVEVFNNTLHYTSNSENSASGSPITIGNSYSTDGIGVLNIHNNKVFCQDFVSQQYKQPIGGSWGSTIDNLSIRNNYLQINGKMINTTPVSGVHLAGIYINKIIIDANTFFFTSAPSSASSGMVISLVTQGSQTIKQIKVTNNIVEGAPSSYNRFFSITNGGTATTINELRLYDNDLTLCSPIDTNEIMYNSNTITNTIIGANSGFHYPFVTTTTPINGWVNSGGSHSGYVIEKGVVRLFGLIQSGTIPSVAIQLPSCIRPKRSTSFSVFSESSGGISVIGRVIIGTNGTITVQKGDPYTVVLDSISFIVN